ncbi:hypothetical protein LUZ60_002671 [Juncus effusus]|nr:hypothetical protein LUZ60_002671 [Juncus effusus]
MELPSRPSSSAAEEDQLRIKRKTLETVLEQCKRALEMINETDLSSDSAVDCPSEEDERDSTADSSDLSPADTGYETDELCDRLKSRVESPEFLEKLGSIYQGNTDETASWAMINGTDIWDDKNFDESDGFVLVKQEDIVDGIACFMAAYLLSLKETKELTPNKLQEALSKTFSVKNKKSRLRKAWDGANVVYNVASWSATAIGIYQNPAILKAATAAFWTSCRVISKLM